MDSIADWVWFGGGGAVGLSAIVLLYWALFHDRSRGRRRCPKCWYDLSASPPPGLRCSECGFTAKRERRLLKTRRRWRRAALASLLLFIGGAMMMTPTVMHNGWATYVPTAVLVWLAPTLEDHPTSALGEELRERVERGDLRPWHWNTLMRQVEKRDLVWPVEVDLPERWLVGLPFEVELMPPARSPFWAQGVWFVVSIQFEEHEHVALPPKPVENPYSGEEIRRPDVEDLVRALERNHFRRLTWRPGATVWLVQDEFRGEASSAGEHEIVFNVEMFSRSGRYWTRAGGGIEPGKLLWTGRSRKTIRVAQRIDDVMTPVRDDALADKMAAAVQVVPVGTDMRVYRLAPINDERQLAIGGEAVLYRNGKPDGRTRLWVDRDGRVHTLDSGFGSAAPFQDEEWMRNATWLLRFRSGPEAIHDADATHYWDGEFEVELAPHTTWHHWLYPVLEKAKQ